MKKAKGTGGISGKTDDDDFQVVPVESTSEYQQSVNVFIFQTLNCNVWKFYLKTKIDFTHSFF